MTKTMTKDQEIEALENLVKKFARQSKSFSDKYVNTANELNEYKIVFNPLVNKLFNKNTSAKQQASDIENSQRVKFIASILKAFHKTQVAK